MTKQTTASLITAAFIFLFVYTAVAKLLDYEAYRLALHQSPLIAERAGVVAWALPLVELAVAVLLLFSRTRRIGFYAATILMVLFTLYVLYMLLFSPSLPCSCGGIVQLLSWKGHLVFNLFFCCLGLFQLDRFRNSHLKNAANNNTPKTNLIAQ